jgi:hypothetical protein
MKRSGAGKSAWFVGFVLGVSLGIGLAAKAGSFLIVDAPQPADVIVVLAGETDRRPQRALELLAQGYGKGVILDVPNDAKLYSFTEIDLAQKYIRDLPQAESLRICPIIGLSTKDEAKDADKCLRREGANRVLIVTSDYHTRRALNIFQRVIPGRQYSIAAARNDEQFGARWWAHRQWAKTFVDEWLRLLWWKVVDQWR